MIRVSGSARAACRSYVLLLALMCGLLLVLPVYAQESTLPPDSINLTIEDFPANLTVGQSFVVSVVSRMDTPAYGFGFQVQYDPAMLEVFPRPSPDGSDVPFVMGVLFGQNPQRIKNADEPTGEGSGQQIDVVYTLLPPEAAASGTGTLGTVAFTILAEGRSEIRLVNPRLIQVVNGTAQDIPLSPGSDTLTVEITAANSQVVGQADRVATQGAGINPANDSPSVALIVAVGGLGIALLLALTMIVLLLRRRKQDV